MACARLLQELSERGHPFQIEVIGKEPYPSYNRILLSSLLAGKSRSEELTLLDEEWYEQRRISIKSGETVIHIEPGDKLVTTNQGRRVRFDKLVLATGSVPFFPPINGIDRPGVLAFRDREDLDRIRKYARNSREAVIIGGGLLGLEAAAGLISLGLKVTVINREPWLMPRQLDETAANILQQNMQESGIRFELDATPLRIEGKNNEANQVVLDNGKIIPADLTLITAGIVPNKELAETANIDCDRGILVDHGLATSQTNIFALGECCQLNQQLFGLVEPVYQQAEVLAARLCGDESAAYFYREVPTQLKVAGLDVVSAGQLPFPDDCTDQIITDPRSGIYRRLVFRDRRLIGFLLIGDARYRSWYRELMESGTPVSPDNSSMMFLPVMNTQAGQSKDTTAEVN